MNDFNSKHAYLGTVSSTTVDGADTSQQPSVASRLNLSVPDTPPPARPRIVVLGVGGAGGNAVNNMIRANLTGVDFVVANTDAQALQENLAPTKIQLGGSLTEGLGAGTDPETGRAAAEESIDSVLASLEGAHMVFITAGMGGGTGTGAAPEIAKELKAHGVLTVGVVTKPFDFEGLKRKSVAEQGIERLGGCVDTMIVIANQHLFRIASDKALFTDAMKMADEVLYNGVRAISDLITGSGTWNLDFADVRTLMTGMGKAMMGTGEAEGDKRATRAAELAIKNPLLEDMDLKTAKGMLINISAGDDLTFYEVEQAATRVRSEVPLDAAIVVGQCNNPDLNGRLRVSVIATGLEDPNSIELDNQTSHKPMATAAQNENSSHVAVEGEAGPHASDVALSPPSTVGEPTLAFGQMTTTEQGFAVTEAIQRRQQQERQQGQEVESAISVQTAVFSEQNAGVNAGAEPRIEVETETVPSVSEPSPVARQGAVKPPSPAALAAQIPEQPKAPAPGSQHLMGSRPMAVPPMPRHRDAQAVAELSPQRESGPRSVQPSVATSTAPVNEAQTHVPAPHFETQLPTAQTQQTSAPTTAYEQAVADARQRAAIEAYEREQANQQAQALAAEQARSEQLQVTTNQMAYESQEQRQRPTLRPERVTMGNAQVAQSAGQQHTTAERQYEAATASDERENDGGILGRMRNMVSKAARPTNRGLSNESSSTIGSPEGSGPYDGGPSGPGGGHTASLPVQDEYEQANQAMAQHQSSAAQVTADRHAAATQHRIQALTNHSIVDDQDDELLMDIPAFLRRQYN